MLLSFALNSGAVVNGTVRHTRYFIDVTHQALSSARLGIVVEKKRTPELREEAKAYAYDRIKSFYVDVDASESDAITLSDVTIVWDNGDGLKVPGMRLGLDGIAAWWLAPGQSFSGPKDGNSGAFVGVAIPIG